MDDLEQARDELETASEHAGGVVHRQVNSLKEGIFEVDEGDKTQSEPAPHLDRVDEMIEKLDGLEEETEDETVRRHIANAREHLETYTRDRNERG